MRPKCPTAKLQRCVVSIYYAVLQLRNAIVFLECFVAQTRYIIFAREGDNVICARESCNLFDPSCIKIGLYEPCTVHPESFRSNAQNAITFARRNHPRVNRSDRLRVFICVRLRLHAFVFACVCVHLRVLFAIECVRVRACNRTYVHVKSI